MNSSNVMEDIEEAEEDYSEEMEENQFLNNRLLLEIPQDLIEEILILAKDEKNPDIHYLLYSKKPENPEVVAGTLHIDGYVRIPRAFDYDMADVKDISKFVEAGCFPLMLLQVVSNKDNIHSPSPRDIMIWWIMDNTVGYPLTHALATMKEGRLDISIYNFQDCYYCAKKWRPNRFLQQDMYKSQRR